MSWGAPGEVWALPALGSLAVSRAGEPVLGWAQGSGGDLLCRWEASQAPRILPGLIHILVGRLPTRGPGVPRYEGDPVFSLASSSSQLGPPVKACLS